MALLHVIHFGAVQIPSQVALGALVASLRGGLWIQVFDLLKSNSAAVQGRRLGGWMERLVRNGAGFLGRVVCCCVFLSNKVEGNSKGDGF